MTMASDIYNYVVRSILFYAFIFTCLYQIQSWAERVVSFNFITSPKWGVSLMSLLILIAMTSHGYIPSAYAASTFILLFICVYFYGFRYSWPAIAVIFIFGRFLLILPDIMTMVYTLLYAAGAIIGHHFIQGRSARFKFILTIPLIISIRSIISLIYYFTDLRAITTNTSFQDDLTINMVMICLNLFLIGLFISSFEREKKILETIAVLREKDEEILQLAYKSPILGINNLNAFRQWELDCRKSDSTFRLLFLSVSNYDSYDVLAASYTNEIRKKITFAVTRAYQELLEQNGNQYLPLEQIFFSVSEDTMIIAFHKDLSFHTLKAFYDTVTFIVWNDNNQHTMEIPVSFYGLVMDYPRQASDYQELYVRYKGAHSYIKASGNHNLTLYTDDMFKASERVVNIQRQMLAALAKGEMYVLFQPKFNSLIEKPEGYEALVRWSSPILGFVSPTEFIPLAEESGDILNIDNFVLNETCSFIREAKRLLNVDVQVAVNVSLVAFIHKDYPDKLLDHLRVARIDPKNIILEMTETSVAEFIDPVIRNLEILKSHGIRIHLDDFGTGYSSLNQFGRLDVDVIKIDKSFIDRIVPDQVYRQLIGGIINMAHQLNKSVIAEGVETREQYELLQTMGCDSYQGYLYSKPIRPNDVFALYKK